MSTTWSSPVCRSGVRWNREIYWGGADTVMCVGEANVSDLVHYASITADGKVSMAFQES